MPTHRLTLTGAPFKRQRRHAEREGDKSECQREERKAFDAPTFFSAEELPGKRANHFAKSTLATYVVLNTFPTPEMHSSLPYLRYRAARPWRLATGFQRLSGILSRRAMLRVTDVVHLLASEPPIFLMSKIPFLPSRQRNIPLAGKSKYWTTLSLLCR